MKRNKGRKYSDEINDIIERMPTQWSFVVAVVFTVILVITFTIGFLVSYPDTVSGQISITSENAPVRIVAEASGRLRLLKADREQVKGGERMAYIENGCKYEDFVVLKTLCQKGISQTKQEALPQHLKLGQLSSAYNNFVVAYRLYWQAMVTNVYSNMRDALATQIEADKASAEVLRKEMHIKSKVLMMDEARVANDSTLWREGGISKERYQASVEGLLGNKLAQTELAGAEQAKRAEVRHGAVELARVSIDRQEQLDKLLAEMMARFSELSNQTRLWEEQYLLKAPMDGKIEYLGFLRNHQFVQQHQELLSITPAAKLRIGEMRIPAYGAGKVAKGQEVNVKLNDYPYNEYGMIKGKVFSISTLPGHEQTDAGQMDTYLVKVDFPQGLVTNYGNSLAINLEAKGMADIVTKKKRLIQRLFDNLTSSVTK